MRIDLYPTDEIAGWRVRPGRVLPYGPTLVPGGVNFSVFSAVASSCTLVLFDKGSGQTMAEIKLPDSYRIGDVWAITVFDLDPERFTYGFRVDGPNDPRAGHRCSPDAVLLDTRARAITFSIWACPGICRRRKLRKAALPPPLWMKKARCCLKIYPEPYSRVIVSPGFTISRVSTSNFPAIFSLNSLPTCVW